MKVICWILSGAFGIMWWVQGHPAMNAQTAYTLCVILAWMATLKD